jgi:hypothetical protein
MEIKFEAACVKKLDNKSSNEITVTISEAKQLEFLNSIMDDKLAASFFQNEKVKNWLAEQIGVTGLLNVYSKTEVLEKVGWEYIKEFFLDHMNTQDILNHVGWETTSEHFADKIATTRSQNDINTNGNKSILETLDVSEGENK